MKPRYYQTDAVDMTYEWMRKNKGNPCIVLPTGSGKSLVIAMLIQEMLKNFPTGRVLKLTGRQELIQQNAEKLLIIWPNAPLGIYSAGLGRSEVDQITYAGVQTIKNHLEELGNINLVIVDEAHEISHKDQGTYRNIINNLSTINPRLRVIGLTATPYRLGHGMITDGDDTLFDELIDPVSIAELQANGFLSKLTSKATRKKIDLTGLHTRGGDFIESEMQARFDDDLTNHQAVDEIISRSYGRKAWLFFCSGVEHALHIRDILREKGISAETITGKTPKEERKRILADYKAGKITALTNANVLTTGFDYPGIDLIVFLRPTMSPGLYQQMAGRGLRIALGKENCLVLDFAGVVEMHGPITDIKPPKKPGEPGVPPSKICPICDEIIPAQSHYCPVCEHEFDRKQEEEKWRLHENADIMGTNDPIEIPIEYWSWEKRDSKNGTPMIVVSYRESFMSAPVNEFLCLWHGGFATNKAKKMLDEIIKGAGDPTINDILDMNNIQPPKSIKYIMDGKYPRVIERKFDTKKEIYLDEIPF